MEFRNKIIQSTTEIFTTMVMMDVAVVDEDIVGSSHLQNTITGIIGLAGTHKGVLAIHFPNAVACAITSSFLGMDVEEINEDVEDAIGEIANMLGGNIKAILSENGKDINLSLPTTISGKEYEFQTLKAAEITVLKFETETGSFIVEVQIEN